MTPVVEPPQVVTEAALPVWDEMMPESFEPQEALDVMDETADEFGDEAAGEAAADHGYTVPAPGSLDFGADKQSGDADSATEEPRSRRRRRRRGRGRGREDAPAAEARAAGESGEETVGDGPADDEVGVSEDLQSDVEELSAEPAEGDRPEGERTERRGRRRGRGRGRGRDRDRVRDEPPAGEEGAVDQEEFDFEGADEESADDEGAEVEGTVTAEAPDQHDEDGEHDFDDDDDGEDVEDGDDSPRIGFRNIPTWQDAIGVMIAKNLESRSRNPAGPRNSGGRGGRGGGRGRGRRPDRR